MDPTPDGTPCCVDVTAETAACTILLVFCCCSVLFFSFLALRPAQEIKVNWFWNAGELVLKRHCCRLAPLSLFSPHQLMVQKEHPVPLCVHPENCYQKRCIKVIVSEIYSCWQDQGCVCVCIGELHVPLPSGLSPFKDSAQKGDNTLCCSPLGTNT